METNKRLTECEQNNKGEMYIYGYTASGSKFVFIKKNSRGLQEYKLSQIKIK